MRQPEDQATYYHVIARDTDLDGITRCVRCGMRAEDVHEILPKSSHGSTRKEELFDIKNRCCLCRECHRVVHNRKGRAELLQILKQKYKYEYNGEALCILQEHAARIARSSSPTHPSGKPSK